MMQASARPEEIKRKNKSFYNFRRLIDREYRCFLPKAKVHIISDVDKTYLETKFSTKADLLKIAFESHEDKVTVHGASELMQTISSSDLKLSGELAIHFVSASPPQLRNTIEMKLAGDRVSWNSTSFKNQTYNLKKRKFHLLRNHLAYKCSVILSLVQQSPEGSEIYLIGDNAEKDSFIYLLVKLVLEKRISPAMFQSILVEGNTPKDSAKDLVREFSELPKCHVKKIFIRKVPGHTTIVHEKIRPFIHLFDHYLEPALHLFSDDAISNTDIVKMVKKVNEFRGDTYKELLSIVLRFNPLLSDAKKELLNKSLAHYYLTWPELKEKKLEPIEDQASPSYSHVEYMRYLFEWIELYPVKT